MVDRIVVAVLAIVLVVVLLGLALAWKLTPTGKRGEILTQWWYLRGLDRKAYTTFNDLYLPRARDKSKTAQVDHLIVSRFGIFVIETKNFNGRIYGKPTDQQWTLTYGRRTKHTTRNPIRQNRGHADAVARFLGIDDSVIIPLVALVGRGQPQTFLGEEVVTKHTLATTVRSYRQPLLASGVVTGCRDALTRHVRSQTLAGGWRPQTPSTDEVRSRPPPGCSLRSQPKRAVRRRHREQIQQEEAQRKRRRANRRRRRRN